MLNQPREPQPYEDCQAKWIQEFGWTSQGMDWGWGEGIKSHHTQTCQGIWLQLSYSSCEATPEPQTTSGVLPGLRRRRTGLLSSGPKSSFQMRASFVFHLETKVLESRGRVEKLIAQVAWSPVLSFHSLWWFGVQCHLLVLVHCVFLKTNATAPVYQEILEQFMLPSADQLFKDADFIFQQDLAPAHTAKNTKSWLNDHGVGVLDWPANSPDLNPIENLWGIVKRKMRNKRPKNADELKAAIKETWASIPPQQCHKLITSMPRWIEAVIKAKGAPTMYWVHIQ